MAYSNLSEFIKKLEQNGELLRVKEFVNPDLEITEVVDRISKSNNNKAILFENTGTKFPLLINSMGSYNRMCMALGVEHLDDITKDIEELLIDLQKPREGLLNKLKMLPELKKIANFFPQKIKGRGASQKHIIKDKEINIFDLPVLKCWPYDGGKFITLPVIHTVHPLTQSRNVGMYRMQLFKENMTGMHWHKHKVSAAHFNEYKKLNKKMPIAVILGGDPVYTYAATAPLPENVDEYILAGFLRKESVKLVQCITQPEIWIPEDADFVIEGYVDPDEELILEGPFGDHTGFYSLADMYPRFHITAITHRDNPIYPATIVGIPPQEDAWIGKATERIFIAPIKMTLCPEVIDMDMPIEGVFHNLVIAQIKKTFSGQAFKVMNAMWGAGQMMFNKILVIADENANIQEYLTLLNKDFNPSHDIAFSKGPMDVLDHSCSKFAYGGKMCFDLTKKTHEEIDNNFYNPPTIFFKPVDVLYKAKEIININTDLIKFFDLPILIVTVKKNRKKYIQNLHQKICTQCLIDGVKMILYLDNEVDIQDISLVLWIMANNLDPTRDVYIYKGTSKTESTKYISCVGFDGTIKTNKFDNFEREWPNPIVSDEATINSIDRKWKKLQLGEFIPSPSLKYISLIKNKQAKI